ncbi:MAG: response regulator [Natronohydrobacter sp.]|nr:response regulator [Natronohydrobacter sp.]
MSRLSVKARLLTALSVLASATLIVGIVAWIALGQGTERLERLHGDTLARVDAALRLSRQSAELATQAPYLLTLDSPFRIEQEGARAKSLLLQIAGDVADDRAFSDMLIKTRQAIAELVDESVLRAGFRDRVLRLNAELASIERQAAAQSAEALLGAAERQAWMMLQGQAAALLGAGRAENLVGVGEYQRAFTANVAQAGRASFRPDSVTQERLLMIAQGPEGLFELRRLELASKLRAEAALNHIRQAASELTAYSATQTEQAQASIAEERARATTAIALAKSTILTVGMASAIVALLAALFVSQYVTGNLRRISDAMMRLASGDRQARLPRGTGHGDEIGNLFHAFRVFRANAIRLDRSNRQMMRRTALYDNMMKGISDGVAILSDQGHLIAHNARLAEVLRIDPARLLDRPRLGQITNEGSAPDFAAQPSGITEVTTDDRHLEWRSSPLPDGGMVVLVADITERRNVADRLQQIQRIEALGKVSGEVAHDFGNILSTISGNLHLLQTAPAAKKEVMYQTIASAVDLGMSLTGRLLSFARRQHLAPEIVELAALVEGMADLIGFALRDEIALQLQITDRPLPVLIDPGQLESTLLNLCLNAGQAIEETGTIVLKVSAAAGQAIIEVEDTGCGMSPDVLAHVMEPFYTTREGGTGLGLAMVYGFINQSGGDVKITSKPGAGTRVTVSLPLHGAAQSRCNLPCFGTVLIVEDDTRDQKRAQELLSGAAGSLICTASPEDARAVIARGKIDLIVTDLMLHGRTEGWALARTALATNPNTRVVVASGHMPAINPLADIFAGRIHAVAKPLSARKLAEALSLGPKTDPI